MRRRLDVELVRRGLVPSRTRAVEAIDAGRVLVGGAPASTAARQVDGGEAIALLAAEGPAYVSRGGHKLAAGLDAFAVDPEGRYAVDVGASTGGFTDCLLQRGAAHVYAIDVGRSQIAWSLRQDARVTVMERTNVRLVDPTRSNPARTSASPISRSSRCARSRRVCSSLTTDAADFVLLVKPQYEAGRARIGRRGIVRDPEVHAAVLREVVAGLDDAGLGCHRSRAVAAARRRRQRRVPRARAARARDRRGGRARRRGATRRRTRRDREPRRRCRASASFRTAIARWRTNSRNAARRGWSTTAWKCAFPPRSRPAAGLDAYATEPDDFAPGLDLVISLGGDGTMLHAVQLVYPSPVPLMGVNVGLLGYLSELEPDELEGWLPRLLAGEFEISERMMLSVDVESAGAVRGSWYALNEAVIEKLRSGHLIYLDVSINGTAVHLVRGRRPDRRHADRQHRVLVLGRRSDRVARPAVHRAHADLAAHVVRPITRVVRPRGGRVRGEQRTQRGVDDRRSRARRAVLGRSRCAAGSRRNRCDS